VTTEPDNAPRWDGRSPGHYEVWYLTFNHRASELGFWIRYTLEAPTAGRGPPHAQLWFAFFDARDPARTFGINKKVATDGLTLGAAPFQVAIDGAELAHGSSRGALEGGSHSARWALTWTPGRNSHRHMPAWMYRSDKLAATKVLSPNVDVGFSGVIEVDGRRIELSDEPGSQTHIWGRKHAHEWAWGHCNAFEGYRGAVLEVITARLERASRVLPPLTTLSLTLGSEAFCFTGLRHALVTRGSYGTAFYEFAAHSAFAQIEGRFSCRPEDMLVATYSDPDGAPAFCANTEVADLWLTVYKRPWPLARLREHARLVARRAGHFEVARRHRDPAIANNHTRI
jgi:hypothetical protein